MRVESFRGMVTVMASEPFRSPRKGGTWGKKDCPGVAKAAAYFI